MTQAVWNHWDQSWGQNSNKSLEKYEIPPRDAISEAVSQWPCQGGIVEVLKQVRILQAVKVRNRSSSECSPDLYSEVRNAVQSCPVCNWGSRWLWTGRAVLSLSLLIWLLRFLVSSIVEKNAMRGSKFVVL